MMWLIIVFWNAASVPGRMRAYTSAARGGPGESRIDVDDLRAVLLGLPDPLEGHGVVLGDVAAFHQDRLAVLQVDPVVGHRAPPECGPQTGDRGAMSKPGLVLDVGHAEQPGRLLKEVALLVGVLRAAHEADRVGPIDGHSGAP